MTTEHDEALRLFKQAGALNWPNKEGLDCSIETAIEVIHLARAQPQGEPVAWLVRATEYADHKAATWSVMNLNEISTSIPRDKLEVRPLYTSPLAQAIPEGWVLVLKNALERIAGNGLETALAHIASDALREYRRLAAAPKPGGKDE